MIGFHDLRYIDGGRSRPIVYRASLTEMVVPYGEPSAQQARKNAFDVGEYGIGYCATPWCWAATVWATSTTWMVSCAPPEDSH